MVLSFCYSNRIDTTAECTDNHVPIQKPSKGFCFNDAVKSFCLNLQRGTLRSLICVRKWVNRRKIRGEGGRN